LVVVARTQARRLAAAVALGLPTIHLQDLVAVLPPAQAFSEARVSPHSALDRQPTPAVVCSVEVVVDSAPPATQQEALAATQLAASAQVQ
jgi:hypothetical protein